MPYVLQSGTGVKFDNAQSIIILLLFLSFLPLQIFEDPLVRFLLQATLLQKLRQYSVLIQVCGSYRILDRQDKVSAKKFLAQNLNFFQFFKFGPKMSYLKNVVLEEIQ